MVVCRYREYEPTVAWKLEIQRHCPEGRQIHNLSSPVLVVSVIPAVHRQPEEGEVLGADSSPKAGSG